MWEIIIALALLCAQTPEPQYNTQMDRTYLAQSVTATDEREQPRRFVARLNYPGRQYRGDYAVLITMELRQRAGLGSTFSAQVGVTCGKDTIGHDALYGQVAMDAETAGVNTVLTQAEFEALIKCDDPRLTIAGITVKFPDKEKARLRELRAALK